MVVLVLAALAIPPRVVAAAEPPSRPNVLFILADDLGYGDTGPYGQKKIRTPALDRLAHEGMRFSHHYSGSPVCAPARCVLLTGRHPGHAFVRDNREVGSWYSFQGQIPLPAGERTIARFLHDAGYATAAFGKWGLGGVGTSGDPLRQGFDHFFGFNDQRHAHNYFPHFLNDDAGRYAVSGNENVSETEGLSLAPGADPSVSSNYARFSGRQYAPDLCLQRAVEFIRANRNRPFFLYYPTTVPHLALQVPEDSLAEYRGKLDDQPYAGGKGYLPHQFPHAAYAAMITRMDRDIGSLLAALGAFGLEGQTIVVFTSDNGGVFPLAGVDPAYFKSNGDLRGYKGDVYEGGMREPLIVRWPGRVPAGAVSDRVTGFEDWLPTLLDLAGVGVSNAPAARMDGISFAPTLLGGQQAGRPFLYREFAGYGGQIAVRAGDWKLVRRHLVPAAGALAVPTTELYDLGRDPNEQEDVAATHPDVVARLEEIARREHRPSAEFPIPLLDAERGTVGGR